eukprot:scaffold2497_cov62-Phaeocystis_antarctica.AAC.3
MYSVGSENYSQNSEYSRYYTCRKFPVRWQTSDVSAGRWMKVQGQFERRAHNGSLIIIHVGIGQRCHTEDVESPAILPTTSTHVTFQRGDG